MTTPNIDPENQGHSSPLPGSIPELRAEKLIQKWEESRKLAAESGRACPENRAVTRAEMMSLQGCIDDLRWEMEAAKERQPESNDEALRLRGELRRRLVQHWHDDARKLLTAAGVPEGVEVGGMPGNSLPHRLEWFLLRRKDVSAAERSGVLTEMNAMEKGYIEALTDGVEGRPKP